MKKKAPTLYDILSDPEKRRAWIIYQLSLQDKNLSAIAAKAGKGRQTIYKALTHPYPKMEKLIADELGMLACDLFPERYTHGLPNRVMGRPKKPVEAPPSDGTPAKPPRKTKPKKQA